MKDEGVPVVVDSQEPETWQERMLSTLRRRVPIVGWLPKYTRSMALGDLVAGITLGLTLVPQSIAYAALAGIPVQRGLYSALAGGIVYAPFGTVKQVSIGPTSLMAIMTLQATHNLPIQYVPLLAFLSGIVILIMGLLRLGFLVELISPAATGGFTSGTALIIVISQLKGLLGLSFLAESVFDNAVLVFKHITEVRLYDCLLSVGCCTVLLLLRKLKDVKVSPKRRVLKKTVWLTSISRNAFVVTGAAVLAFLTRDLDGGLHPLFKLSGRVQPGLPSLMWPAPLQMPSLEPNSTTPLFEATQKLGGAMYITPVVMVLANIAIAKAFCLGRVDATQEMLALGLCNVLGACLQAMPTCGAFTRSAVSHASGVRTPAAGLYSGIITLLALVFLTEYFYYIPRASLSAVLVCAVIFMIDISQPRSLWSRGERVETLVWGVTLVSCVLLGVEPALVLGGLLSLAGLLRRLGRSKRPPTLHKTALGAVCVMPAPPALVYLNVSRWTERANVASASVKAKVLLIHCGTLTIVDDAAVQELELLSKTLSERGTKLAAYDARPGPLNRLSKVPALSTRCLRAHSLQDALAALDAPAGPTLGVGPDDVPLLTINSDN